MVDQKKVQHMAQMSILEQREGVRELKITSRRMADYVILQIIKSAVAGTLCYLVLCVIWILAKWETLNAFFADGDFFGFFHRILFLYLVFMAAYLVCTWLVAVFHYRKAGDRRRRYLQHLRAISNAYAREEQ